MAKIPRKRTAQKSYDLVSKIAEGIVTLPDGYKPPKSHEHKASFTSTRKAIYRGKKISVRTTYRIEIDDQPLMVHTSVLDDGAVHCHGLPNYSFPSALDLTRALIDAAPLADVSKDEIGGSARQHKGGHE